MKLQDIKQGDTVYECQYGMNLKLKALTSPERHDGGWRIFCETETGKRVELYCRDNVGHYGPQLYKEPQYAEF